MSETVAWPFSLAGNGASRQYWENGQTIVKMLSDINCDFATFLMRRVTQNAGAVAHLVACHDMADILKQETDWFKATLDEYSEEAGRLMEMNSKMIATLMTIAAPQTPAKGAVPPSA